MFVPLGVPHLQTIPRLYLFVQPHVLNTNISDWNMDESKYTSF